MQSAFADGQRALADIVPGQPAQHPEVLGSADVHEPQVDHQAGIKLAAGVTLRAPWPAHS